jgi:TRAP-type uncharacterized transport system substrate-binding protein
LYTAYRLIDPLPPRQLAIAAGMSGSGYDNFARQYAKMLACNGVELKIRISAGAVENLDLLRDPASGVQAALTTFGFTQATDVDTLYSLGGIFDAAIFVFYRNAEPIPVFSQFRGKRLSIGVPGSPLGQTLIITSGLGWVQHEGGSIEEVRTGDVVWFSPGLKHWHGATSTTAMTHIAIQESLDGKNVDWMEKVSDEQYRK